MDKVYMARKKTGRRVGRLPGKMLAAQVEDGMAEGIGLAGRLLAAVRHVWPVRK